MTTKHPNFNYMMAEHLNVQIDLIKCLQASYAEALLAGANQETLQRLDEQLNLEISFLEELYNI